MDKVQKPDNPDSITPPSAHFRINLYSKCLNEFSFTTMLNETEIIHHHISQFIVQKTWYRVGERGGVLVSYKIDKEPNIFLQV